MPPSNLQAHASAGIDTMDHEHALELQMVRALQAALAEGDRARVIVLMDQLETFANAHFLAEQHLMRLHAYPGFASHLVEHDRLIAELREISTRIFGDPGADTQPAIEALELWLLTHIHTEDEALAAFLRQPADAGPAR
jgi:hemerythrin-like metal-binding protein